VDIRGGSQDLCKFSSDLRMRVSIYYKVRYAVLVFNITYLVDNTAKSYNNRAAASTRV